MQVDSVAADSAAPTSEPIGEGAPELVSVAAHSAAPVSEIGSSQLDCVAADSAAPNAELTHRGYRRILILSRTLILGNRLERRFRSKRTVFEIPVEAAEYQSHLPRFLSSVSPLPGQKGFPYPLWIVQAVSFSRPRSPSPRRRSPSPSRRDDSTRFTRQSPPRYGPNVRSRSPRNTNPPRNFSMRDAIIHPVENIPRERLFNMNPASGRTRPPPLAPRAMQTQSASKPNNSTTVESRPVQTDILNIASDATQVEPPNLLDSAYARISPLPAETTIDYALCLLTASARTSTEGFSIRRMFLRTTSNGNRELWVQGARVQDILILTGAISAFHELRIERVAADLWQHMRSSASESFNQRIRHRQHDQRSLAYMREFRPEVDISPLSASEATPPVERDYPYVVSRVRSPLGMFLVHEEVNSTTVRGTRAGSHRRSRRGGDGNAGEGSVTGDRTTNTLEDRLRADQIPPLTQRLKDASPRQPARTSLISRLSRSAFQESFGAGSSRTTLRDRMRTYKSGLRTLQRMPRAKKTIIWTPRIERSSSGAL
ncbi:hypothetical protein CPB85DRAFT_1443344 [Mucidula mucida]|nr:hypothetical protein CPB85DRAFT_1443344 [Mucidula mucida]